MTNAPGNRKARPATATATAPVDSPAVERSESKPELVTEIGEFDFDAPSGAIRRPGAGRKTLFPLGKLEVGQTILVNGAFEDALKEAVRYFTRANMVETGDTKERKKGDTTITVKVKERTKDFVVFKLGANDVKKLGKERASKYDPNVTADGEANIWAAKRIK